MERGEKEVKGRGEWEGCAFPLLFLTIIVKKKWESAPLPFSPLPFTSFSPLSIPFLPSPPCREAAS